MGRLDIALTQERQAPRIEAHAARTGGPATAHWSRHCRRLAFHQYDDQIANRASPSRLLWCTSSGCPESRTNEVRIKGTVYTAPLSHTSLQLPHFTNSRYHILLQHVPHFTSHCSMYHILPAKWYAKVLQHVPHFTSQMWYTLLLVKCGTTFLPATAHWSRHCRRLAFHQYDDQYLGAKS